MTRQILALKFHLMPSSQHVLLKGENLLLVRPLFGPDGVTPLPVASAASIKAELYVENKLVGTYILGTNPELRAKDLVTVELEITTAMSTAMPTGRLRERWTITTNDASFIADASKRTDIVEVLEVLVK